MASANAGPNSAQAVGASSSGPPSGAWSALRSVFRFLFPPRPSHKPFVEDAARERMRAVERRDWWLWLCAILITLLLTATILSFILPEVRAHWSHFSSAPVSDTVFGLVGLVLLFDIYTVYQHFQIQAVRKQLIEREELFRLITENAADMIAV